jgi:hypothetical protein
MSLGVRLTIRHLDKVALISHENRMPESDGITKELRLTPLLAEISIYFADNVTVSSLTKIQFAERSFPTSEGST